MLMDKDELKNAINNGGVLFSDVYQIEGTFGAAVDAPAAREDDQFLVTGEGGMINANLVASGDKKQLQVVVGLSCKLGLLGEDKPEEEMDVKASVEARYIVNLTLDPALPDDSEAIESYREIAKEIGVVYAWPYFCEFMSSSLARLRIPPVVMRSPFN